MRVPTVLVLALAAGGLAAQAPDAEAKAKAYVEAFNAGEAAMAAWMKAHVSEEGFQRRPLAARLENYRRMRADTGALAIQGVDVEGARAVALTVEAEKGRRVRVDLAFGPDGKLEGIRMEDVEAQEAPVSGGALSQAEFLKEVEAGLAARADADAFAGSVLVAKEGKPLLLRAYGLANRELRVPNRPETKFNFGSIGKAFTKVAIAQFAAEGKLSFDDPIAKFLPDYPDKAAAAKVKIRHLLDMSSGIADFFGPEFDGANKEKVRALQDYLPFFATKPLAFEPGTGRAYSNGGYLVLGLILEKISGMDYHACLRQRVFGPAGMADTGNFAMDEIVPGRAEGYLREGGLRRNLYTKPARGSSAGGGYSTAPDLLRFAEALKAGKLLPPGLNAWMLGGGPTPPDAHPPVPPDFKPALGIAGGAPGINAVLEMDGGRGRTLVVLCNDDPPMAERTARWIRGLWGRVKE